MLPVVPLIFDHAKQPAEGHWFPDPTGLTLRAKSIEGLLIDIAAYRANNGFAPGNPAKEVEQFYAKTFPWLVSKIGETPTVLADPVATWVHRMWRNPPKEKEFAESEAVVARLVVCAKCPHYAPDHPFDTDTLRRVTILSVGRSQDAGACKAHHWAVGLAVLTQQRETTAGCWASDSPSST